MSSRKLSAHLIGRGDLGVWDDLASRYGTLFQSIRWTSMFEPGIQRIGIFDAGGSLRGGFCIWRQRKFGLRILRNPPFTPQIGPFFEYRATNAAAKTSEVRQVMEAMAGFLDRCGVAVISLSLSLEIKDCLPFYWRKFKVIPHYTFQISLNHSSEDLMRSMSVDRRKAIHKAQKDGIQVQPAAQSAALRNLAYGSFHRNGQRVSMPTVDNILAIFVEGEAGFGYVAYEQGRVVAGAYVVHDSRTAYYVLGGYADGAHHGAGALAMWHAILGAKELGLEVFDFEGSVVPPIERFFRGFGGRLTPYFSVHKARLPLEMALKLVKRELF